jgi:C-terminal processing protease CtpA/Prc
MGLSAPALDESTSSGARGNLEGVVPALSTGLESGPGQSDGNPVPVVPVGRVSEEERRNEVFNKIYADALQQENERAIALGISNGRMQLLKQRSEELEARRRSADADRQEQGVPMNADFMAYRLDGDLDLVDEIGVDEYEKFRKATGRSTGIEVVSVLAGGIGERAGLKEGDEIRTYDGKRVFNSHQLGGTRFKDAKPGQTVLMEVLRDGQHVLLPVTVGSLDIVPRQNYQGTKTMRETVKALGVKLDPNLSQIP